MRADLPVAMCNLRVWSSLYLPDLSLRLDHELDHCQHLRQQCHQLQLSKDCDYCPFDYVMQSSSSTTSRSVTCTACNADSNCQRCLQSNTATCTSCDTGTYFLPEGLR